MEFHGYHLCWVLVNINCHLSWKWMDKWLPALVINPLVWGLFFCELQLVSHNCWFFWQCLWHWFLWLVFFGEFIWPFSGVFLYRSVWYERREVRRLFPGEVWSDRTTDTEAVSYTYQSAVCCVWGELCGMLD